LKPVNLLFYISGFGYGHLTRSVALIGAMLAINSNTSVTIKCHPQHFWFVEGYLRSYWQRVTVLPFTSSFRIVFDQRIWGIDKDDTIREIVKWIEQMPEVVQSEIQLVKQAYDLVISDIVPEAFAVARHFHVRSIAISNFTWYEIAKSFMDEALVRPLRDYYNLADAFFEYDLSTSDEIPVKNRVKAGLICRPVDQHKVRVYRQQYKRQGRPLLFLSIGGAIGISDIPLGKDADYLCTQGINLPPLENVQFVPQDALDTQNYLTACDGVITKCGWSTVAETLIAQKPLFLLQSSNGWAEEAAILRGLQPLQGVAVIDAREIAGIACGMAEYSSFPSSWPFHNNVVSIAQRILTLSYE
jgi:hypothetical protein